MERINYCTLFALCLLIGISGCGLKKWPSPRSGSDSFAFANVSATSAQNCLFVQGVITGNLNNVESVTLEIESATDCPDCPFNPVYQERMSRLNSERLSFVNNTLTLTDCAQPFPKGLRIRLLGHSLITGEPVVLSDVIQIQ